MGVDKRGLPPLDAVSRRICGVVVVVILLVMGIVRYMAALAS